MNKSRPLQRINILAIILLVCMAIFVLRLFWLQVVKHGEYTALARKSQQRSFIIPAERGEIYMKDGKKTVPVVLNRSVYTVIADPALIKSSQKEQIVEALNDVAGGEVVSGFSERLGKEKSRYELVARHLSRSQAEKLKEYNFSGIGFQQTSIRSYPEGKLAAQVLGFVNADGAGQYGVEQSLDDRLKGHSGLLQSVTDIKNVPLTLGKDNVKVEPKPGENLVLTIDRNIQSYAEEALQRGVEGVGASEGSVVIVDPNDGSVLAMANYPSFNPGEYSQVKDSKIYSNPVTSEPYEPASVIKSFIIATGVDKGVIAPSTTYNNTDCIQVADRRMCNATKGLAGVTSMQEGLNHSLNVGSITAARRLGDGKSINLQARQTMYDYYHDKFGLGQKTGIEIGETQGYIYPPDSAEGNEVRYSAMTYGQSLSVTMIQVVAGFSSMINGGEYYQPSVLAGTVSSEGISSPSEKQPLRRTISEGSSSEMVQMLTTARRSSWVGKSDKQGYQIGGKTGTAETITAKGDYTQSETVATYLGFGGSDSPRYVIMVRVAAPGKGISLEGGIHASPIFTDISNWMIDYLKLAPRRQ